MQRKIRVYCTIISYRIMNPEIEWMNNIVVMGAFLLVSGGVYAQENSTITNILLSPFTISGYTEAYYSVDLSKSFNDRKSSFFVSCNRNDEPAANLAFLKHHTILKISKPILH